MLHTSRDFQGVEPRTPAHTVDITLLHSTFRSNRSSRSSTGVVVLSEEDRSASNHTSSPVAPMGSDNGRGISKG